MPTYRNDTQQQQTIEKANGHLEVVDPGETIETHIYYDIPGLTKLSDTPLYNPVAAQTPIASLSSTPVDIVLQGDTKKILITQITGLVTARPQVDAAVPLLLAVGPDDPMIVIDRPRAHYDRLRLSGTGSCTVTEYR